MYFRSIESGRQKKNEVEPVQADKCPKEGPENFWIGPVADKRKKNEDDGGARNHRVEAERRKQVEAAESGESAGSSASGAGQTGDHFKSARPGNAELEKNLSGQRQKQNGQKESQAPLPADGCSQWRRLVGRGHRGNLSRI